MSNFGFSRLRLVKPYDLAYREAKSAVGAARLLEEAEVYDELAPALAGCHLVVGTTAAQRRELAQPLRRLEYASRILRKRLQTDTAALLFGSEKHGLSNEDLSYCHWLLRIPTRAEHSSMNLGQAVAVCLYELSRNPQAAVQEPKSPVSAPDEDLERLASMLEQALQASGYLNPVTASSSRIKLRRLIRRMDLSARDAEIWQGILRQILWKLGG
jgi:tRNA/rRNA methyltransferase